ncbi:MAG: hypothetical protein ACK559_18665, partial [bacterium]
EPHHRAGAVADRRLRDPERGARVEPHSVPAEHARRSGGLDQHAGRDVRIGHRLARGGQRGGAGLAPEVHLQSLAHGVACGAAACARVRVARVHPVDLVGLLARDALGGLLHVRPHGLGHLGRHRLHEPARQHRKQGAVHRLVVAQRRQRIERRVHVVHRLLVVVEQVLELCRERLLRRGTLEARLRGLE